MSSRLRDIYPSEQLIIRSVGLRDGLQLVKSYPSSAEKLRWLDAEYEAGLRHFEVGSYLPATSAPQFADVDQLVAATHEKPNASAAVLSLNPRGFQRALDGDADEIVMVVSASEEHNKANIRRSRAQSVAEIKDAVALRNASARKPLIMVGIAMSLGCSISGPVSPIKVLQLAEQCVAAGVDVLSIADTVGYGGPTQIAALMKELVPIAGDVRIGFHLHDTRGLGLANAAAALDAGVRILDASLAGLGGCPFAPRATGNIVLEDLVFLTRTMGFATGIDIDRLIEARNVISRAMPEETLYGGVAKSGLPLGMNA